MGCDIGDPSSDSFCLAEHGNMNLNFVTPVVIPTTDKMLFGEISSSCIKYKILYVSLNPLPTFPTKTSEKIQTKLSKQTKGNVAVEKGFS